MRKGLYMFAPPLEFFRAGLKAKKIQICSYIFRTCRSDTRQSDSTTLIGTSTMMKLKLRRINKPRKISLKINRPRTQKFPKCDKNALKTYWYTATNSYFQGTVS